MLSVRGCDGGVEVLRVDEVGREVLVVDVGLAGVAERGDRLLDTVRTVGELVVGKGRRATDVLELGNGLGLLSAG